MKRIEIFLQIESALLRNNGIRYRVHLVSIGGLTWLKNYQGEFAKPLLVEFGAQTALADFLHRRDFWDEEEKAKGDFLVMLELKGQSSGIKKSIQIS